MGVSLIEKEYMHNEKFKKYVDGFCDKNGCEVYNALNDEHIRQIFWRYTDMYGKTFS